MKIFRNVFVKSSLKVRIVVFINLKVVSFVNTFCFHLKTPPKWWLSFFSVAFKRRRRNHTTLFLGKRTIHLLIFSVWSVCFKVTYVKKWTFPLLFKQFILLTTHSSSIFTFHWRNHIHISSNWINHIHISSNWIIVYNNTFLIILFIPFQLF